EEEPKSVQSTPLPDDAFTRHRPYAGAAHRDKTRFGPAPGGRGAEREVGRPFRWTRQRTTGRRKTDQPATTSLSRVALTSGCSLTVTWWEPVLLIGLPISMRRRSSSGPPAAFTASAMSPVVTEPNRRPLSPARVVSRILSDLSCSA